MRLRRAVLIVAWLAGAAPLAMARAGAAPADTLAARVVPQDVLDAYRADPDFQYDRPEAEGPSLMALFWRWLQRTIFQPLADASQTDAGEWVLIALAVAALAWGLTRVLRVEGGGVFARGGKRGSAVGPLLDVDRLDGVDLAPLLAAALADGRLRDAVRFRFLVLLQHLDGAGALGWRRDKTNRDYARDVTARRGADAARAFGEAARAFDYVWYGERAVDGARYARLDPLFARAEAAGTAGHRR